ncbi:MAG: D-alanyl-D-alanine carboxypeptidase family protein [Bacillota bacterium]
MKYRLIIRGIAIALCILIMAPMPIARAQTAQPEVKAGGIVLIEATTGKVLYAKNAHVRLPMASTTKVMTAMLALEHGGLDALVEITEEAYGEEGSSMYLELGEKISLRDLLHGLMLVSGNDAAVAIADYIGGSVENFALLMNQKAKELGALNTSFVTPNGLHDDNHYTTAYDLALICQAAMKMPEFRELVSTTSYKTTTGSRIRYLKSKNRILTQYDGGNGIKTGYTKPAGKCLTFAAERDEMQLIGVVLNCPNMFPGAMSILDYGFTAYKMETIVHKGDVVTRAPVKRGIKNVLALVAKQDIMIPVLKEGERAYRTRVVLNGIAAPIAAGDELGRLEVWEENKLLTSTALVAGEDVAERDLPFYLQRILLDLAQ